MHNIWIYMIIMAVVTYAIRMLPLVFGRKEIKNKFIRSFLYYVPYVCLAAMTFPAVLSSTSFLLSAIVGFVVALILAYFERSAIIVMLCSCVAVMVVEMILKYA